MEPQNTPEIVNDRGSSWLAFTINHDLETAFKRFEQRFGYAPLAWAKDPAHRLLLVGPVVEVQR